MIRGFRFEPRRSPWLSTLLLAAGTVAGCGGGGGDAAAVTAAPATSGSTAAPATPTTPTTPTSPSTPVTPTAAKAAYYVEAGKLHDPCGTEVVPRGVNKMAVFNDRTGNSFPEIAKTGANIVRFMWVTAVPASEAEQTLQRAVDSQLIPVWELHDATGDFSKMPVIDAFWSDPATIAVLRKFESHLIVNLANEAGITVADSTFTSTYTSMIAKLRAAGLRMPFMVDAANFGTNVEQLLRLAPAIQAADPLHNLLFSWHFYDSGADQPARIGNAFSTALAQKIPLLVGEFGSVTPAVCGNAVDYRSLITQAQGSGIGYMAWSWDNINSNCIDSSGSAFDMVSDGVHLSTLKTGYASDVVMAHPASIQKTAVRTRWQTSGVCTP